MAIIVIKDLTENVDLDREAMIAIIGGSRVRSGWSPGVRTTVRNDRLVNFPRGSAHRAPSAGKQIK